MISKNIPYGTLEVDTEKGVLWLNCLATCLLRIQNIEFKVKTDKFSMIDINGTQAFMYPGESSNKHLSDFLETVILLVGAKIIDMNDDEKKDFLDKLIEELKKGIRNVSIK